MERIGRLARVGGPMPRRQFLERSLAGVATFGSLGVLLQACGGDESPTGMTAAGRPPARATGTFVVALAQAPTSLDPGRRLGVGSFYATANLYDGLVTWNRDFTDVAPQLCESWSASPDAREWTGKLRSGMTFHDGSPIDAAAIKRNFEYFLRNSAYLFIPLPIERMDARGDTIRFVFSAPYPTFAENVTLLKIQSPRAIAAGPRAIDRSPIGSGAFAFVSQTPNEIRLRRFEGYWNEPRPYFEELRYKLVPDAAARIAALRSGQVNLATNLAPDDVVQLESDARTKVVSRPSWMMTSLNFKLMSPAVNDLRVRQAVAYAIDREAIMSSLGKGKGRIADAFMMPGIEGYTQMSPAYAYDPDKARELLREVGGSVTVRMAVPAGDAAANYLQSEAVAQAIAAQLNDVGIDASVDAVPEAEYQKERAAQRPAHPVSLGGYIWFEGGPTVWSFMESEHNMQQAYPSEYAHYRRLWDEVNTELDRDRRAELIAQIQQIHTDVLTAVPLFVMPVADGVTRNVEGYTPDIRNFGPVLDGTYFAS